MSVTVVSIWCRLTVEYWSLLFSTEIYTLGGNAFGAPCVFPFKHQGKWYAECIPRRDDAGSLWCATSTDFDKDQLFGNCPQKGNLFIKISAKLLSKIITHCYGQNVLGVWKYHWTASWTLSCATRKWGICSLLSLSCSVTKTAACREYSEGGGWDWWIKEEETPRTGFQDKRKCSGLGRWDVSGGCDVL